MVIAALIPFTSATFVFQFSKGYTLYRRVRSMVGKQQPLCLEGLCHAVGFGLLKHLVRERSWFWLNTVLKSKPTLSCQDFVFDFLLLFNQDPH